ncbi:hypothetical protein DFJ73DRAFT_896353 [Zopfochytrium polystomum]|nr:hypothetical protein DFJ73DRAFT_896353 [Zopfochytrium polystomum]
MPSSSRRKRCRRPVPADHDDDDVDDRPNDDGEDEDEGDDDGERRSHGSKRNSNSSSNRTSPPTPPTPEPAASFRLSIDGTPIVATATTAIPYNYSPLPLPSSLLPLASSHHHDGHDHFQRLRAQLARDGYLHLRGVFPRAQVSRARREVLVFLHAHGATPARGSATAAVASIGGMGGGGGEAARGFSLLERQAAAMAASPSLRRLVRGDGVFALFAGLFFGGSGEGEGDDDGEGGEGGEPAAGSSPLVRRGVRTIAQTWLRAVPPGRCTGAHFDRAYLGNGSQRLLTLWMPLGDVRPADGSLCVVRGSHALRSRPSSGGDDGRRLAELLDPHRGRRAGADGAASGYLPAAVVARVGAAGGEWVVPAPACRMGDAVVFGLDVLHATAVNESGEWRLSCETRWQPACDAYPPFYPPAVTAAAASAGGGGGGGGGGASSSTSASP